MSVDRVELCYDVWTGETKDLFQSRYCPKMHLMDNFENCGKCTRKLLRDENAVVSWLRACNP